jgi:hypothetical protein
VKTKKLKQHNKNRKQRKKRTTSDYNDYTCHANIIEQYGGISRLAADSSAQRELGELGDDVIIHTG